MHSKSLNRLFRGWFQVMPVVSSEGFYVVLDDFRSFQIVPRFSKYMDVRIKNCRLAGACSRNSVGKRGREI